MKLKALRSFLIQNGRVDRGAEFETDEKHAKKLVARGLAAEVKAAPKHKNKKAPEPENKSAD